MTLLVGHAQTQRAGKPKAGGFSVPFDVFLTSNSLFSLSFSCFFLSSSFVYRFLFSSHCLSTLSSDNENIVINPKLCVSPRHAAAWMICPDPDVEGAPKAVPAGSEGADGAGGGDVADEDDAHM